MVYVTRDIEGDIERWLFEREILLIRGPRQSGKTTLLYRIMDTLKERGIDEDKIHYFNMDDDENRIKFTENWKEFISFYSSSGKNYFLLDEIQAIPDVGKYLKLIYDTKRNVKVIATGSSSFDLTSLGRYLVGRVLFFDLHPFSFGEFLRAKSTRLARLYNEVRVDLEKPNVKRTVFLDDLNRELEEYLTYGSFPRVVLERSKRKKREIIKNLILTYMEKDIVGMYGPEYRDGVMKLLTALSVVMGSVVNYEKLSEISGLKSREVRRILPILETTFSISIVKPFYQNLSTELRKNPKIYFLDYGVRNYLARIEEVVDFGPLYEAFVFNQLKRRSLDVKYWRTTAKTEVDFIIWKNPPIPIEVKSGPRATRALLSFMKTYKSRFGMVANLNTAGVERKGSARVFYVPLAYF